MLSSTNYLAKERTKLFIRHTIRNQVAKLLGMLLSSIGFLSVIFLVDLNRGKEEDFGRNQYVIEFTPRKHHQFHKRLDK